MEHEFEKKVGSGLSVIVMMSFDSNYHSVTATTIQSFCIVAFRC